MAVTLIDIANKAGVSVSTVSRVLSGKSKVYRISEKTQKLVIECAEKFNYRPNAMARGLRTKKSNSIGLVVPDISNPFFAYVTRIIQSHAHNNGYSMVVCNTDENIDSEKEQIELLRSKGVDGMIVMPVGTRYEHLEDLLKNRKPLVTQQASGLLQEACFLIFGEGRLNRLLLDME